MVRARRSYRSNPHVGSCSVFSNCFFFLLLFCLTNTIRFSWSKIGNLHSIRFSKQSQRQQQQFAPTPRMRVNIVYGARIMLLNDERVSVCERVSVKCAYTIMYSEKGGCMWKRSYPTSLWPPGYHRCGPTATITNTTTRSKHHTHILLRIHKQHTYQCAVWCVCDSVLAKVFILNKWIGVRISDCKLRFALLFLLDDKTTYSSSSSTSSPSSLSLSLGRQTVCVHMFLSSFFIFFSAALLALLSTCSSHIHWIECKSVDGRPRPWHVHPICVNRHVQLYISTYIISV